jgi:hypothetical protein
MDALGVLSGRRNGRIDHDEAWAFICSDLTHRVRLREMIPSLLKQPC